MRHVQCFYCGVPGDWPLFDTEMDYQGPPGGPMMKRNTQVAICDVDLERHGPPALPKRSR